MHYEDDRAGLDIGNQHHRDGQADQQHDTECRITVLPTVILTELNNGR